MTLSKAGLLLSLARLALLQGARGQLQGLSPGKQSPSKPDDEACASWALAVHWMPPSAPLCRSVSRLGIACMPRWQYRCLQQLVCTLDDDQDDGQQQQQTQHCSAADTAQNSTCRGPDQKPFGEALSNAVHMWHLHGRLQFNCSVTPLNSTCLLVYE